MVPCSPRSRFCHRMSEMDRRTVIQWASTSLALGSTSLWANPRVAPRAESPLVGTDPILISTGLTSQWQTAMRQDLGWSARWQAMETRVLLDQLEQGHVDAGLFLHHPRADELDKQGLIHSRQTIARTDVLIVGPEDDVAGIRGETDPGRALRQIMAASAAGAAQWRPTEPGSALSALADRWTQGQIAKLPSAPPTLGRARPPAYRLITQAQWQKLPPKGEKLKVWMQGGPSMQLAVQVACSFRVRHPGAKLLVSWLQWPLAQGVMKRAGAGWQPAATPKG